MSKAPAKAEGAEGEAAPAKGGKKKMIIIIVAVLVLAIAGAAAFMMMGKKKHAEGEDAEEEAVSHEPPKVKVDPSKPPIFVQLEQFTVNLAPEEGEHFLQSTMVLMGSRCQGGRLPEALHARTEAPHHHAPVFEETVGPGQRGRP